jgi:hypothetical protein
MNRFIARCDVDRQPKVTQASAKRENTEQTEIMEQTEQSCVVETFRMFRYFRLFRILSFSFVFKRYFAATSSQYVV